MRINPDASAKDIADAVAMELQRTWSKDATRQHRWRDQALDGVAGAASHRPDEQRQGCLHEPGRTVGR